MERAFEDGYFPENLALGLETGWTLTEIRELDPMIKRMYIEFLITKQTKEKEEMDKLKEEMDAGIGSSGGNLTPKDIQFIKEEDFYSNIGGGYIKE